MLKTWTEESVKNLEKLLVQLQHDVSRYNNSGVGVYGYKLVYSDLEKELTDLVPSEDLIENAYDTFALKYDFTKSYADVIKSHVPTKEIKSNSSDSSISGLPFKENLY